MQLDSGRDRSLANGRKVLLVDDEAIVLRALTRMLEHDGYQVEGESDPLQALRRARETEFDAIITDLGMPVLGGLELLEEIRCHGTTTPVIILSGSPHVSDVSRAIALGAFRFLTKPFEYAELSEVLRCACAASMAKPDGAADRSMHIDAALDAAWLEFQPLVDRTGQAFAWEALLRVPDDEFSGPQDLIEAAERAGRVNDVGKTVRSKIPGSLSTLPPGAPVCVNVHPGEVMDPNWLEDGAFAKHSHRIILELTERARYDNLNGLKARIALMKERGFRIALDDLGAGYAGLGALSQLSVDMVKLDGELTRRIDEHDTRRRLAASLIDLSRDLRLPVVAEGVESEAERDTMLELGVQYLQGYLFAKPGRPPPDPKW
ncbi:MAG TPA: EAL domain-containing response regulator [Polyangiaceae bacterium]|nr:EAL domain-containing response regulator [Polyangiaceae bacterium]